MAAVPAQWIRGLSAQDVEQKLFAGLSEEEIKLIRKENVTKEGKQLAAQAQKSEVAPSPPKTVLPPQTAQERKEADRDGQSIATDVEKVNVHIAAHVDKVNAAPMDTTATS